MCVPAYSLGAGILTEVQVGPEHGLRQTSLLRCDEVRSVARTLLRNYIGDLPVERMEAVNAALRVALEL